MSIPAVHRKRIVECQHAHSNLWDKVLPDEHESDYDGVVIENPKTLSDGLKKWPADSLEDEWTRGQLLGHLRSAPVISEVKAADKTIVNLHCELVEALVTSNQESLALAGLKLFANWWEGEHSQDIIANTYEATGEKRTLRETMKGWLDNYSAAAPTRETANRDEQTANSKSVSFTDNVTATIYSYRAPFGSLSTKLDIESVSSLDKHAKTSFEAKRHLRTEFALKPPSGSEASSTVVDPEDRESRDRESRDREAASHLNDFLDDIQLPSIDSDDSEDSASESESESDSEARPGKRPKTHH